MGIEENVDLKVKKIKSRSVKKKENMKCNSKRKRNETKDAAVDDSQKPRKRQKTKVDPLEPDTTNSIEELSTESSANHDSTEEQNGEEQDEAIVKKPKKISNRQLKKEKAQKRIDEQRTANKLEIMQKALTYVSKWKHAKNEWKFEKLKQVWLMDNLFDKDFIPDENFPTVLEYFEGCKGMAREKLFRKAMNIINGIEENEKEKDELINSVEYKRARELMQIIPSDA